jgi:hypothetical protein
MRRAPWSTQKIDCDNPHRAPYVLLHLCDAIDYPKTAIF